MKIMRSVFTFNKFTLSLMLKLKVFLLLVLMINLQIYMSFHYSEHIFIRNLVIPSGKTAWNKIVAVVLLM